MRHAIIVVSFAVFSVAVSGCDFGRSEKLTAQLQQAQAEKQVLIAEIATIRAELEGAKSRIKDLEGELVVVEAIKSLSGDAKKKLNGFLDKYSDEIGEGLDVAKELRLPKLKDIPVDSLLKKALGGDKTDDKTDDKTSDKESKE